MNMHAQVINFDEATDRRGSNSLKWDSARFFLPAEAAAANPLPMWVADMDFRAPQCVSDALVEAAQHGVFGYSFGARDSYIAAVTGWQQRRFGWEVAPDWVVPVSGVITALKTIVQAFSAPGDTVLIQPPVYAHFQDDVLINGRFPACAPLTRTETGYRYDAAVFEAAIRPNTKIFILSNPHNPTGNVWTEDELRSMGEICARHGILVVSDEIHQDLVMNPACRHLPFASLSEAFAKNSITCTAPSKTFNLPGLQCANAFIPNPRLRAEFQRQLERNLYPRVNSMGMVAAEAAYTHGEAWLDTLITYVRANHVHFAAEINGLNAGLQVLPADALYLAWMDCRALGLDPEALERFMLTKARLWLDKGPKFGTEGHGYMRVNLGCTRATVDEAIARLKDAVGRISGDED
ncbi:MalY/PatB family protein [Ensifer aridi]|uniref:MalY/PatB family protein n=1 Tax=Ensifer aridi TaxID=1708715 RepID=UPI000A1104AB|nr:MalY/PatB family protein [Ensifer aridi]